MRSASAPGPALELQALNLKREAAQDDHEANLWEPPTPLWTPARPAAQDRRGWRPPRKALRPPRSGAGTLREDRRHLAQRKGQVTRAENGTDRDAQDEARVRLDRSQKRVNDTATALADATAKQTPPRSALEAHRAALHGAAGRLLAGAGTPASTPAPRQVLPA